MILVTSTSLASLASSTGGTADLSDHEQLIGRPQWHDGDL
jgi:hypothetical protein